MVPCYDEERRLDAGAFLCFLAGTPDADLVLVDDGSSDGTRALLEAIRAKAPERVRVRALDANRGKAEAVRLGLLDALSGPAVFVGYWDADLATPLSEVGEFVRLLRERSEVEIVYGARVALVGRSIERSALRHYVGRVSATLISVVTGLPTYDTQCGAKLFRASAELREVLAMPFLTRWLFDVEILVRFDERRRRTGRSGVAAVLHELPLERWHDVSGSKVGPLGYLRAGLDLAALARSYPSCRPWRRRSR